MSDKHRKLIIPRPEVRKPMAPHERDHGDPRKEASREACREPLRPEDIDPEEIEAALEQQAPPAAAPETSKE